MCTCCSNNLRGRAPAPRLPNLEFHGDEFKLLHLRWQQKKVLVCCSASKARCSNHVERILRGSRGEVVEADPSRDGAERWHHLRQVGGDGARA